MKLFSHLHFNAQNWQRILVFFAATGLVGCTSTAVTETPAEKKLTVDQAAQLSSAAASVNAAKFANSANPEGLPKQAVAGELAVADANLPAPKAADATAALQRVNAALAGDLRTAREGWSSAVNQGNILTEKVSALEKQVTIQRAEAAQKLEEANNRLCIVTALVVGAGLFVISALSLAAGLYFSLPKLEYGACGLALSGTLAFFAATQVGTVHFDILAMIVLASGLGGSIFVVWFGFSGGSTIQSKANGFDAAIAAVRKFAGEVTADAETDAKTLWHWLGTELDKAQKALVADWDKLESAFSRKKTNSAPGA